VLKIGDVSHGEKEQRTHVIHSMHQFKALPHDKFSNLAPLSGTNCKRRVQASSNGGGFSVNRMRSQFGDRRMISVHLMDGSRGYHGPSLGTNLEPYPRRTTQSLVPANLDRRHGCVNAHPAPYPIELAERLVRMFRLSVTQYLTFMGTGTTALPLPSGTKQRWN
jgi:hypothetical protein